MKLLRGCLLNFERLDIWRYLIGHPSKNIVVWIFYELPFSIWSISIYYETQSDIWVKSYYRLNLVRAAVFNLECLDILRDSIILPCIKLLSLGFATSFHFQFGASRYISGLNRTSEYKVIVVWNCSELVSSILSVLIYDGTQSDIRVKIIVVWICYKLPFSIWSISIYYGTQSDIRKKNFVVWIWYELLF